METLQHTAPAPSPLFAFEVIAVDQLLQVTPIGGRGLAHHNMPFMPAALPGRLQFGCIKLFATETIAAGNGYAMHDHRNGEIISLVRQGEVLHENTVGPATLIPADSVAVISAGRGIRHAEHAAASGPCSIVQIVLDPRSRDREPRAAETVIPRAERRDRFRVLASGRACDAEGGALFIDQDAALASCVLDAGTSCSYSVEPGRVAYVVSLDASVCVNGRRVDANERILVHRACKLDITASADTELLVLDMAG